MSEEALVQEKAEKPVDHRHLERMALLQALFVDEFPHQSWDKLEIKFNHQTLEEIRLHKAEYDQEIATIAKERPLAELAKIDLAILRLILHESKTKATPAKVLIDEGVELAKDFGGENSYAFINAVLEKLLLSEKDKKTDVSD
ncbi:MAG: transcription antitermination factor NusB [bacterium]|nr:transcription antitermination factor NusB [bacterium]